MTGQSGKMNHAGENEKCLLENTKYDTCRKTVDMFLHVVVFLRLLRFFCGFSIIFHKNSAKHMNIR